MIIFYLNHKKKKKKNDKFKFKITRSLNTTGKYS